MSHLSNPLATSQQLFAASSNNALPSELLDSVRYHTARLTQAAGILLNLSQDVAAQAIVTLYRYWLVDELMKFEFSDVSAASLYLAAKVSASPRSLRSVTNVYAFLLSSSASFTSTGSEVISKPDTYYLSETAYSIFRDRLLNIEGQILNGLGFNTHVALPHSLAITYLQTLDIFGASYSKGTGPKIAKRTFEYLNTALLSPQLLYLTHQPCALATAAIYLAARDTNVKLPDCEWWEVFDTEREELGFLALGMKSLEGWVKGESESWPDMNILTRKDVRQKATKAGVDDRAVVDEEAEMMALTDERSR